MLRFLGLAAKIVDVSDLEIIEEVLERSEVYHHECIFWFLLLFAPRLGLRYSRHAHASVEVHGGNRRVYAALR